MAPLSNEDDVANGDEVMEEEEEGEMETQTRKRKNKKMKMGEESGVSDRERRQLRRDQRDLAQKLQEGPMEEKDEDFVDKARKKNNELFENVRYTREAVLDAENVDTIASKFVKKTDSMISTPRYDATKFITKLKSKLTMHDESTGSSYFDWQTLGVEAGVCFNSIPSRVSFLVGPLANVKMPEKRKVRVARQKKVQMEEEELEEESPEQLKKGKKNVDQLSAAERNFKTMSKVLAKRVDETWKENKVKYNEVKKSQPEDEKASKKEMQEYGKEVDFVPFLVNPQSFTQTVENIFNFSFLVKKGEAKIKMRQTSAEPLGNSQGSSTNVLGLPSTGCFVSTGDDETETPAKQCVLSFTMKDWRALCEAYDLEKCDVPHRKGTKQKATNFSQMSQEEENEEE